jgi:hypothetical protein
VNYLNYLVLFSWYRIPFNETVDKTNQIYIDRCKTVGNGNCLGRTQKTIWDDESVSYSEGGGGFMGLFAKDPDFNMGASEAQEGEDGSGWL